MIGAFIGGLVLGLVVGWYLGIKTLICYAKDKAKKAGTVHAEAGISDKVAVGVSIDWPEILAFGAIVLIGVLLWRVL
jgi:hypothetical protein